MEGKTCSNVLDYINSQLTESEAAAFEQHLKECENCREELQELQNMMGEIPFHVKQVDPPADLKGRVLGHVLEEEDKIHPAPSVTRKATGKTKVWGGVLAAGLILSLGVNIYTASEVQQLSSANEELETELSETRTALSDLQKEQDAPGGVASPSQTAELAPAEGMESAGTATMMNNNGAAELLIQVHDMEELQGNEVYQVWLFEGETPVPAGSFITNEDGSGGVAYQLEKETEGNWDAVAISKEPQPGNEQPQGKVVMQAEL